MEEMFDDACTPRLPPKVNPGRTMTYTRWDIFHRWKRLDGTLKKCILITSIVAGLLSSLSAPCRAGDVEGTVTIVSPLRPRATGKVDPKADAGYGFGPGSKSDDMAPVATLSRDQEVSYVVISVAGTNLPATPKTAVMHQRTREFMPHVLPVVRGSTVLFTNEDVFLHSIYSETPGARFILPKYGRGEKETRKVTTPGAIELFCGIHSRMNAYIYVTDNDYFTQPDKSHHYSLKNLPAGTYTLKVWHPRVRTMVTTVTVPASGTVKLNLTL